MVFWVAFDDNHAVLGSVGHQTTGVGASGKGQVFSFIVSKKNFGKRLAKQQKRQKREDSKISGTGP